MLQEINEYCGDHRICWISYGASLETVLESIRPGSVLLATNKNKQKVKTSRKITRVNFHQVETVLGSTYSNVIIGDVDYLTPSIACQLIETCSAGGLVVLLMKERITTLRCAIKYNSHHFPPLETSLMIRRVCSIMGNYDNVLSTEYDGSFTMLKGLGGDLKITSEIRGKIFDEPLENGTITQDQNLALEKICNIIKNTSSSVISLTAGRGRGKSTLLGIIAARYSEKRVLIIYKNSASIETLQQAYRKRAGDSSKLQTISVSNLQSVESKNFDIIIVDEAATIGPSTLKEIVNKFSRSHVCLSSTVHGYEGTGRAFNNKLLKDLVGKKFFTSVTLTTPVRYYETDLLEALLYELFLLDVTDDCKHNKDSDSLTDIILDELRLIHMDKIELLTNRDLQTKFHEVFGMFINSHYKNSPNDILLFAESPAHEIYTLNDKNDRSWCAIQVAFEGDIPIKEINSSMGSNGTGHGNLISWKLLEYFRHINYNLPFGARIVRIATDSRYHGRGIGSLAIKLLLDELYSSKSHQMNIKWVGTSFGCTAELLRFWSKSGFAPVYLSSSPNEFTGQHSLLMLHSKSFRFLDFTEDFLYRFTNSLPQKGYASLPTKLVAEIIQFCPSNTELEFSMLSGVDNTRIRDFLDNQADNAIVRHLISDSLKSYLISNSFISFTKISAVQLCVLIGMFLQGKESRVMKNELNITSDKIRSVTESAFTSLLTIRKNSKIARKRSMPEDQLPTEIPKNLRHLYRAGKL